ncbi:MAG: hypothetical protein EA397_08985 [Deltaproteobacteria bacterium]|nr:MAG: hypothetical protein EA397_08985 [Deltaproteobacteria bacterium]
MLFSLSMLLASVAGTTFAAEPITVQGPQFEQRRDAAAHAQAARAAGLRPRLQRRFHHAEGWRWTIVFQGFSDLAEATGTAERASSLTGRSYVVYGVEPITGPRLAEPIELDQPIDPVAVMLRTRRNHGPIDALERVEHATSVTFRFIRRTPDGRTIHHEYVRDGRYGYLKFWQPDVPGAGGEFIVRDGQGFSATPDGDLSVRDLHRTRDRIARFAPERVLHPVLLLSRALIERRELALATPTPGRATDLEVLYAFKGDHLAGPARLWIDPHLSRVLRFELGENERAVMRELRGSLGHELGLPRELITRRGGVEIDRIQILELSVTDGHKPTSSGAPGLLDP